MILREPAFRALFYFMQERMEMFWRRYRNAPAPWTDDPVLRTYKFTNVYRSLDRVSQYLLSQVIYRPDLAGLPPEDVLLRVLVFKIFNRIETWELLERERGVLTLENFNAAAIGALLSKRILTGPVFTNAYVMAGSHARYDTLRYKHEKYLAMVQAEWVEQGRFRAILDAPSLSRIYDLCRECSLIGPFLAYQYAIDFNYTPFVDHDENSFVKAGVGAVRGVHKCFSDLQGKSPEDAVRWTHDRLQHYQELYGFTDFKNLFGRDPTIVDVQSLFCETDKYLRATMPKLSSNRVRLKQKFMKAGEPIDWVFPPKWKLNQRQN